MFGEDNIYSLNQWMEVGLDVITSNVDIEIRSGLILLDKRTEVVNSSTEARCNILGGISYSIRGTI